ncbi:MAG TPA: DUF6494 family protein [Alphaproteobacteria bacterium]|jgi:hypothetical protein|nr:DUF6494 family protein [Alphaproteobacteria bacterium]
MNEEMFNMDIRKFLKLVGVTSQREIEVAVRNAVRVGALSGSESLHVKIVLTVDQIDLSRTIEGTIALE